MINDTIQKRLDLINAMWKSLNECFAVSLPGMIQTVSDEEFKAAVAHVLTHHAEILSGPKARAMGFTARGYK